MKSSVMWYKKLREAENKRKLKKQLASGQRVLNGKRPQSIFDYSPLPYQDTNGKWWHYDHDLGWYNREDIQKLWEIFTPKPDPAFADKFNGIWITGIGDDNRAEELKKMFYGPESYNIVPVIENYWEEEIGKLPIGLFIPAKQNNIDEYGTEQST